MVEMSHTTYKSEDGILSEDQLGSPLVDEGNSGGTVGGGVLLKKGPWTSAEDAVLVEYVKKYGEGNWNAVQKHSGLSRCGKSCRLRWANHLRPNLKKGTFTPEEEQLIVELHAKMGNKWARMAAHLPGRTDNEIKNYWNTRVKRRQRASLPLYPPEVCLQVLQEKQQNQNDAGISCGDKRHHDLLQSNSCGGVPAIMFDRSKKANRNLIPYVADLPEISGMNGFVTPHDSAYLPRINSRKHLEESLSFLFGFGRGSRNGLDPLDPMLSNSSEMVACSSGNAFPKAKNLSFEEGNAGSLSLLDGNFSASKPCSVAVKLELPSLQYPRTDLSCWGSSSSTPSFLDPMVDDFIQCSSGIIENGNLSPKNSGLLDALLIESKTLTCARNQSSDKSSNSSAVTAADITNSSALNLCETEWEDYSESISPLGHPVTSMSNECAPMSASGSSIEHPPAAEVLPGYKEKPEAGDCVWTSDGETDTSRSLDIVCRPDALLDSCGWLEQSPFMANEEPVVSDAIQTFLSDALGNDYENLSSDTSASSPGWGLGSCASWNHMPHAVYQMPELP